jgi:O-antigen/teichoic acid export membrane protein
MYELSSSLGKIARGTGIAVIGITLGLLFSFVVRLVIARYGTPADYGIFSLTLAVLNIAAMLAGLGLYHGAARYIAFFRGKGDVAKVRNTISVSIRLSTIAGIVLSLAIFLAADLIASKFFHTPELALPLKIFAAGIPFFTLIQVLAAIFRGFDRTEPMVIFQYLMLNVLFLGLLSLVVVAGLPLTTVFYAYLAALVITFCALAIYAALRLPQQTGSPTASVTNPITRELLLFSLPLLGATMLIMVMTWTDTLMLGYFRTPSEVGLYNTAQPLAQFISTPLNAMILIYIPIATGLFSRNEMSQLRATYAISTRWIVFMTLPVFLILFLFPEAVLSLFFGAAYVSAAAALRILSLGFMITNLLGTNGAALIAMGHSKFIMWASLATATINIALNVILIPSLGIVGAATASVASLTLINIIVSVKLYLLCRAQPFSKNLLKPAIVCIVLAFLIQVLAHHFLTITWWLLVLLFIVYLGIYGLATLFTRSFEKEDIALLLEIEKRSGLNTAFIKKILNRFVQL